MTAKSSVNVTVKASRSRRVPAVSPAQSAVRKQTTGLSIAYAALPMLTKQGWQEAANILNAQKGRTGRHKLSAANVYVSVNSMRRLCLLPDTDIAPTDFSLPGEIPTVTVVSSVGSQPFSVRLTGTAYSSAIEISAANGVAAGKLSTADTAFARITTLPSGLAVSNTITAAYVAVWGQQEAGAQIAVRLTAISDAGIRGVPYDVVGVVKLSLAEGEQTEPDVQLEAA